MTLIQEKVKQAAGLIDEFGVDCWITFTRESQICGDPTLVFLAPGPVTWHSAFIVSAGGRTRAIVGLYDQKAVEETGAYDKVVGYVTGIKEPLLECLKELDPRTIAVNYSEGSEICDGLTHGMYLTLHRFLAEIGMADRLVPAERIVSALRERKSAAEIGWMRQAVRVTEEIYDLAGRFIAPGRTEIEIAAFILAEVDRRGLETAWTRAACPAVFTGPDTAQAHYAPTARVVEPGHILNMDFGVKIEGYCSDMQRTFYIPAPGETAAPDDVMTGFRTIVRAVEESKRAMRPGVEGRTVDAVARSIITGAGYAEFPHGLGHQVGRYAHDGTALLGPAWEKYAQKPFRRLEEGMVFTIEPRLTVPGRGVVTIEEMVVVTGDGAEWLGRPQKDLVLAG
ncbi:MAG TPA: Xaa-Pro peptidase family protein [Candidatus Aminicenantes bacterium]|nr:Xaa-Pro peptidase family protein [Candidatus Aminicenantes bacterium]HRY64531.1 Xaa-Pro peptidase family protein [Candidatus Aminicenantes bacterium]HRZ71444.1 Xaa-Pro peptidase family protein [Candidatus Aminicenantes bacterium]